MAAAAEVAGSRNRLVTLTGISRRRLGYLEAGQRLLPDGRTTPTPPTFAEQVTLEALLWHERK